MGFRQKFGGSFKTRKRKRVAVALAVARAGVFIIQEVVASLRARGAMPLLANTPPARAGRQIASFVCTVTAVRRLPPRSNTLTCALVLLLPLPLPLPLPLLPLPLLLMMTMMMVLMVHLSALLLPPGQQVGITEKAYDDDDDFEEPPDRP